MDENKAVPACEMAAALAAKMDAGPGQSRYLVTADEVRAAQPATQAGQTGTPPRNS